MPRIKIDYVVSFTSEDKDNKADSLLNWEVSKKKWLCTRGEPLSSVVLQLKSCTQISAVHVGAYHSAFVEILVGLSEKPNDPYEVLVPSSVFVNPIDSRRCSNIERVRSFITEQLCEATRSKRWDRVRVVCSQPFNKHCQYGLSFLHLFSPDETQQRAASPAVPSAVLSLPTYSSDDDDFKPGELFAKHRRSHGEPSNTETQIKQASSQAIKHTSDSSSKLVKTPITKPNSTTNTHKDDNPQKDRHRDTLMYTDDDEQPHAKIDRIVQRHNDEKKETDTEKLAQIRIALSQAITNVSDPGAKLVKTPKTVKLLTHKDENPKKDRHKTTPTHTDEEQKTHAKTVKKKDVKARDTERESKKHKTIDKRNDVNTDKQKGDKNLRDRSREKYVNDRDERRLKLLHCNFDSIPGTSRDGQEESQEKDKERTSLKRPRLETKGKSDELRPGPVSSEPHTLLSGVVFAISGYENPRRGDIRTAAIAMGADYRQDWTPECTHLVCAFPNTPKLRSVRSHPLGDRCVVVTGEWVEQCARQVRLLPWQWFATEPGRKVQRRSTGSEDDWDGGDEMDTDDEIERIMQQQKKRKKDQPDNRPANPLRSHSTENDTRHNDSPQKEIKQNISLCTVNTYRAIDEIDKNQPKKRSNNRSNTPQKDFATNDAKKNDSQKTSKQNSPVKRVQKHTSTAELDELFENEKRQKKNVSRAADTNDSYEDVQKDVSLRNVSVQMSVRRHHGSQITQSDVKKNYSSQSDVKQNYSSRSDVKQNYSCQSNVKPNHSSRSDDKQYYSSQSDVKQNYSLPSDVKQNYSSQSHVKQNYSSQSDVKQNYSPPSDVKQNYSSQSGVKQNYSSPSHVKQNYSSPSDVKQKYSSPSNVKQNYRSQLDVNQNYSSQLHDKQNCSLQSDVKQNYSPPSDVKQNYSSQSGVKQNYSPPSDAKPNYSSYSDAKPNYSSYSDAKQNHSSHSDIKKNNSSQSDVKQNYSSQSDVKQNYSSPSDAKPNYSSYSDAQQSYSSHSDVKKNYSALYDNSKMNVQQSDCSGLNVIKKISLQLDDECQVSNDAEMASPNASTESEMPFVKEESVEVWCLKHATAQVNIVIPDRDSDSGSESGKTDVDDHHDAKTVSLDSNKLLPDLFDGARFYVAEQFEDDDKEMIERYVTAYGGLVMKDSQLEPDAEVDYMISATKDDNIRSQAYVNVDWLWSCHKEKKLCDVQKYLL